MSDIRRVLSYNDVLLSPRNSELEHISDADIIYSYNKIDLSFRSVPLVNAPMDTICSPDFIRCLHDEFNMPVTIHRWFDTVGEQIGFYEECNLAKSDRNAFIAIGTASKWKDWIDSLINYRKEKGLYFGLLVDIANGDTKACEDTVRYVRSLDCDINLMAGNVAKKNGFRRLQEAGANFIRVGIGGGSICATRTATGFGMPTFTSILDCARVKDTAYLVADGGIEYPGDICKALAAGADMVMAGKLFAGTDLSAGAKYDNNLDLVTDLGEAKWVRYSGMASKEAISKLKSKKSVTSIEGVSGLVPYLGTTRDIIDGVLGNLQTAVSYYAGCKTWGEFRNSVSFLEITEQGWGESMTRVKL